MLLREQLGLKRDVSESEINGNVLIGVGKLYCEVDSIFLGSRYHNKKKIGQRSIFTK